MATAAQTIRVFGMYLLALGAVLIIAPNSLLEIFKLPPVTDVWIRVVGMLAFFLGIYYWHAANANLRSLIRLSVPARLSVLGFFGAFVVLKLAPPMLMAFAIVDAIAALWTWYALRRGYRS
jgi:hypothetical protein